MLMNFRPRFFAAALTIILFLPSVPALSQGTLRGAVTDSTNAEALVGANIFLKGTAIGGVTDIEGKYRIINIPPGEYTVRFSYLGYKTRETRIVIGDGENKTFAAGLVPDVIEGQEVVITAQARGQNAAINQQLTASTIVNVVSEEKIKELPDANAAEAIGRLPGVSLIRSGGEASKVILRGLSDKFTNITIDGVKIPPTDADSRGVDLSTLSQGSLAGIELFKALTPDKDADAIAGTVNLVTKKASATPMLRIEAKGDYNNLMDSYEQYNFSGRYETRFIDDIVGLQLTGNSEQKIRSNETIDLDYLYSYFRDKPSYYRISDFRLEFTDEIRKRNGIGVIFDIATPDSGSIKLNSNYDRTDRNYILYTRNYPTRDGNNAVVYSARERENEINTFNSSLKGENYLFDVKLTWGASFAQSFSETPYDYYVNFKEPPALDNGVIISGMDIPPSFSITDRPERIIPFAKNNFSIAFHDSGIFRTQQNLDKERTAYMDLSKKYLLGDNIAGEVKFGGKYKYKNRSKNTQRFFTPYYLNYWQEFMEVSPGNFVRKNFLGTTFEPFYQRYLLNNSQRTATARDFLSQTPGRRDLFDTYSLYPLVDRDAMRLWYDLNKFGNDSTGKTVEYNSDDVAKLDYYDIIETISSGYIMNTFSIGQEITIIAGVRIESESNEYQSRYTPGSLGGFPTAKGLIRDTVSSFTETNLFPNFHLLFKPVDFLNVRFAAYRALARPDFNSRLVKLVSSASGTSNSLIVGNPYLRNSKAWNYEMNTSVYHNTFGLVSISAFYKEIDDMVHFLNGAASIGNGILDSLGIQWKGPGSYQLTLPYNSSKPTKVWGFEFEHQASLNFLPGYLQFFTLSYNASIVRSETYLISTVTVATRETVMTEFGPVVNDIYSTQQSERKQKLESQPEFYANVSLGYDIGDFSTRVSVFHQAEFNRSFSSGGLTDGITGSFSRLDVTVKYQISDNISLLLNVMNITDAEEAVYTTNRTEGWKILNTNERYGRSADLGVRIEL
jgi:TonB-dependent receptor